MITIGNIPEIIRNLSQKTIEETIDAEGDHILLKVDSFNAGYQVLIKSLDYSKEADEEAEECGDLFWGKEVFIELLRTQDLEHGLFIGEFKDFLHQ